MSMNKESKNNNSKVSAFFKKAGPYIVAASVFAAYFAKEVIKYIHHSDESDSLGDSSLEFPKIDSDSSLSNNICEYCGKTFDYQEEEDYFSIEEHLLNYENVKKRLCGKCAVKAIEIDEEDDIYFDRCDKCGKVFDLAVEEGKFDNYFTPYSGERLRDIWDQDGHILCCDCALEAMDELEEQ